MAGALELAIFTKNYKTYIMKNYKLLFSLILLALFTFSSCLITTENKEKKRESEQVENPSSTPNHKTEGWVEYELRLNLPSENNDNLLGNIIKGAVEGLVEHLDPRFSLKFKDELARIDFEKFHFMHNEFQFDDSIHHTFRLFDFDKMRVANFESNEDRQTTANIEKIDPEKYKIIETDQRKEILGFDCKQTYLIDPSDEDTIIIWYAPEISVPLSPFEYVPVGGLSLEMIVEGLVMRAVQVSFEKMEDSLFQVPNDIPVREKSSYSNSQEEI